MSFQNLRVKPISYKLNGNEELIKKLHPYFNVSAGSFSKVSKKSQNINEKPNFDEDLQLQRKEKANIDVELRDSYSNNLIGSGHIEYDTLSNKEGKFNEWIPLKDILGNEVGKALIEVEVYPQKLGLGADDYNFGMKGIMDEMHERMDRIFDDSRKMMNEFSRSIFPEYDKFLSLEDDFDLFRRRIFGGDDRKQQGQIGNQGEKKEAIKGNESGTKSIDSSRKDDGVITTER